MTSTQQEIADFRPLHAVISDQDCGMRLDYFLAQSFPFMSRHQWQNRVSSGQFLVNGNVVRPSYRLKAQDRFVMLHYQKEEPHADTAIYPIWKEGEIMAVFKPGNLPMHENGPFRFNTFSHVLATQFGKNWAAVHRLDRETSGIVLCSSSPRIRTELADSFARGEIAKEYLAICRGIPKFSTFRETGPIGDLKESTIRIKKWVVPNGLPSETWFQLIETRDQASLFRVTPRTGRTNQIRIHAAFNGLAIIGDKLYHPNEEVFNEYFEARGNTDWVVEQTGFHRLCLHAARLAFKHPETKKDCIIESPLPEDLQGYWDSLPRV